jgi:HEAT repeat protein
LGAIAFAAAVRGYDGKVEAEVAALLEKLESADADVVRQAAQALHELGPDAAPAVDELIAIVERDNDRNRMPAVFALIGIGPKAERAVPALIEAARHKTDFHTRYQACRALGAIGPAAKPAVPVLLEGLKESNPSVRGHAALALGGIGPEVGPPAIEQLALALADKSQVVRQRAVIALGMLGPAAKSSLPAIERGLADDTIDARVDAVTAVYRITGDKQRALPLLIAEIAGDDEPEQAADLLASFGEAAAPAIPKLVELLKSDDPLVRYHVVTGLGRLGRIARPALASLEALADDPNPDIRAAAAQAVEQINR